MKCPFRTEIEYKYETMKEGDGYTYFNKGTIEEYPDCYDEECPYYTFPSGCSRVEEDE
jgi:hypothetical protein